MSGVTFLDSKSWELIVLIDFYFHLVTAYGLLRKEGVQIGKQDYLGAKLDAR